MLPLFSAYVIASKQVEKESTKLATENEEKSATKIVSAADRKNWLIKRMQDVGEKMAVLEKEMRCVVESKRMNNEYLRSNVKSVKDLSQMLLDKKKSLEDAKNLKVNTNKELPVVVAKEGSVTKSRSNEAQESVNDENRSSTGNVLRKPELSDYNFSNLTLALLNNETNSNVKKPNLNDYRFETFDVVVNNLTVADATKSGRKLAADKSLKRLSRSKSTPYECDGHSSKKHFGAKSKDSLTHSGSISGSLIKLTPRLHFNIIEGKRLEKPDFDAANEDTATLTFNMIPKPEMPVFETNLDVRPKELKKPEFPKLTATHLYGSPQNTKSEVPVVAKVPTFSAVGAFKPVISKNELLLLNESSSFAKDGEKHGCRRSVLSEMNVTYVVASTSDSKNVDLQHGKIVPISKEEYSSLESFFTTKITFKDLTNSVFVLNDYLEKNRTDMLTKSDLVEILSGTADKLRHYTLILTKLGRLKKLIGDETFFACA